MIYGSCSIPRVPEESVCRSAKDYRFTELGIYKIHSSSLMPNITFEEESIKPYTIDNSIFINDNETKLTLDKIIQCQNYISAKYIGRAPLEFYNKNQFTEIGRQFMLVCKNGNPNQDQRVFGTEDAIKGYNRNANENVKLPGGGEELV